MLCISLQIVEVHRRAIMLNASRLHRRPACVRLFCTSSSKPERLVDSYLDMTCGFILMGWPRQFAYAGGQRRATHPILGYSPVAPMGYVATSPIPLSCNDLVWPCLSLHHSKKKTWEDCECPEQLMRAMGLSISRTWF